MIQLYYCNVLRKICEHLHEFELLFMLKGTEQIHPEVHPLLF